jgi:hypothetical protein
MTLNIINDHELTTDQRDVIIMLSAGKSVSAIEAWPEPEFSQPNVMGLSFTDDGLTMTGYFTADGTLIGDWLI